MEGPISFWGYKEQETNPVLPEHDDDDDYQTCVAADTISAAYFDSCILCRIAARSKHTVITFYLL